MIRLKSLARLSLLALLALPVATPAAAAESPAPAVPAGALRFAGHYRFAGGDLEVKEFDEAIERVVSRMNFLIRGIARRRLREPNVPSPELDIMVAGGDITIGRPGRPSVSAPESGAPIVWKSPSRDTFRVSHGIGGDGVLYQRFEGDKSLSINRFVASPDGSRLIVETTITSPRLPLPLRFSVTYLRR